MVRGPAATGERRRDRRRFLLWTSLRETPAKLHNEQVRRAVLSAIDYADGNIDKVKANIETWFNGTMDRVSGWYKRRTQMILFAIGVIAALILNVDAITIAQRLTTTTCGRRWLRRRKRSSKAGAMRHVLRTRSTERASPIPHETHLWRADRLERLGAGPQTETILCAAGKPEKAAKARHRRG